MIIPEAAAVASGDALLALCRTIDQTCADQLEELSDSFASTNNRDAAAELSLLASWKAEHAAAIAVPPLGGIVDWYVVDPGDPTALHWRMLPWHLVGIVLDNERRLRDLLAGKAPALAADTGLLARQDEIIARLEARRATLPQPTPGWDDEEDPPFFDQ